MLNTQVRLRGINVSRNDIQIPSSTLEFIKTQLITNNVTKEALSSYIKEEMIPIKRIAYDYLILLNDFIAQIQEVLIQQIKTRSSIKMVSENGISTFIFNLNRLRVLKRFLSEKTFRIIEQTELFSDALKLLMGKIPILAFTHTGTKTGFTQVYIVDQITKILKIQGKSLSPRLRGNLKNLADLLVQDDERFQNYILSGNELINLQNTYKEILFRWTQNIYNHVPSHFILWNMGQGYQDRSNWKGLWLDQRGDIVETYQRAIFTRDTRFTNDFGVPENNIDTFMKIMVSSVDASSGLLQSDIEVKINGIMYSISSKSHGAEPIGIFQAIELATAILNNDNLTEEKTASYLENYNKEHLQDNNTRYKEGIIDITAEYLEKELKN